MGVKAALVLHAYNQLNNNHMIKKALTALGCISLAVNAIEIKSGIKIDTEADADEYEMWPGLQITWVDESKGDF